MKLIKVMSRFGPEGTEKFGVAGTGAEPPARRSPGAPPRGSAENNHNPERKCEEGASIWHAGLFSIVPSGRIISSLPSFPAINCRAIFKCPFGVVSFSKRAACVSPWRRLEVSISGTSPRRRLGSSPGHPNNHSLSGTNLSPFFFLIAIVLSLLSISPALADGGAVQFSQRVGDLQITVMTDPTPLRVGAIDLSILTQNARTGEIATTGRTIVILRQGDEPALLIRAEATTAASTNKLLRSAKIELPRPGRWHLEIQQPDIADAAQVDGEIQVADKPPRWRQAAGWIMIPFVPIGLYIVGDLLAARRRTK